jgi:hypothetical protein
MAWRSSHDCMLRQHYQQRSDETKECRLSNDMIEVNSLKYLLCLVKLRFTKGEKSKLKQRSERQRETIPYAILI